MKKKRMFAAILSALSVTSFANPLAESTERSNKLVLTSDVVVEVVSDPVFAMSRSEKSNGAVEGKSTSSSTYSWSSGPQTVTISGGDTNVIVSNAISDAFAMATQPGNVGSGTVKNAPYRAEIITERVQMLPDGNQIVKRSAQLSFRDSAGRTRIETRNDAGEVNSVVISDSVEGNRLFLSPKAKTATKMNFDRDFQKRIDELRERAKTLAKNAEQLREKAKTIVKDGKTTLIERGPGEEITIKRSEGKRPDGSPESREEVSIRVVRSDGSTNVTARQRGDNSLALIGALDEARSLAPLGALTHLQPGEFVLNSSVGAAFQDRAWSAKATTKELGTRDIDGVRAEGKLRSYSIPAGEIGNKNTIVVSTETWTSPDLHMTVYSKHSDPRVGETIYRVANLKRGEQPLSLFSLPDGYKLRDLPAVPAPPLPPLPPVPPVPPRP